MRRTGERGLRAVRSNNPAAEQGVPGTPTPIAPHEGKVPWLLSKRRSNRAVDLSMLYIGELWRNAGSGLRRRERYLYSLDVTLPV